MKYLFLIKAGKKYGFGHYTRSKSLAVFLKKKGHEVNFWVEGDSIDLQKEFSVIEKSVKDNFSFFRKYINKNNIDVLYADGNFEFDKELIDSLRSNVSVIFYQNLSASKIFCDIFISPYSYDPRVDDIRKNNSIKFYEGFEYYIIRDKVKELKRDSTWGKVENIIITTGGSDPNFVLESICKKIDFGQYDKIAFTALIGSSFSSKRIQKLKALYKFPNLAFVPFSLKTIKKSDVIISTLGVSVFEFLYLGKIVVNIAIKESAIDIGKYLEKEDLSTNLGFYKKIKRYSLNNLLNNLQNEIDLFANKAKRAKKVIDGNGLERVSKILENV